MRTLSNCGPPARDHARNRSARTAHAWTGFLAPSQGRPLRSPRVDQANAVGHTNAGDLNGHPCDTHRAGESGAEPESGTVKPTESTRGGLWRNGVELRGQSMTTADISALKRFRRPTGALTVKCPFRVEKARYLLLLPPKASSSYQTSAGSGQVRQRRHDEEVRWPKPTDWGLPKS